MRAESVTEVEMIHSAPPFSIVDIGSQCLVWYDGPILSVFGTTEQPYLVLINDYLRSEHLWRCFVAEVPIDELRALLAGDHCLKDLFARSQRWLVMTNAAGEIVRTEPETEDDHPGPIKGADNFEECANSPVELRVEA